MSNPSRPQRYDIASILKGGPRTLSSTDGRAARIFREEELEQTDSEPQDEPVQTTAPAYELNSPDHLPELFSTQLSLGREARPSAYPDCRPGDEYGTRTPLYARSTRTPVPVQSPNEKSSKDRESGTPATSTPLPDEFTVAPDGTRMITTSNHPDAPGVRVTVPFDSFKPKSSPTSDGAKHTADREGRDPNSSTRPPPSHPHRTPSSAMGHAANKSFPPLFSLIRRRSLPHIARPDFGREKEHNQTSPRPSDGPTRPSVPGQSRGRRPPRGREYETSSMSKPFRGETATMTSRGPDGSMHVYSTHHQPHTSYVPLPMNIPSHSAYALPSLTSYGPKHTAEVHCPISSVAMSHFYVTQPAMAHPTAGFSSSLPASISAPIPIRRHSLPHIAYPEYGREEAYNRTVAGPFDDSTRSPPSPKERSFTDTEYEVTGPYAAPVMSTPFRGATTVIEPGSHYAFQRPGGHTQEGSDGSNSGWRTVAANVIDWSGKAHGHHSLDGSSGSTVSNTTAVGEQHQSSVPYPMAGTHSDFPMTPGTVNTGSYRDHGYYEQQHARPFNPASPSTAYYEAAQSPNYVLSPPYPMSQYHGSFGSPQAISPVALIGSQQPVVPKTEFEPDLASSYPNNIWQQPHASQSLQEDDDKDTSVDDDTKSPSPDSSLPNTPAPVELELPPVVPSRPFASHTARVSSVSPPPHADFDIQITSSGNIRMPRSCRSNVPVPIPSLTKKSRGRRVPTKTAMTPSFGLGTRARTFTCTVDGCGKRFNRGEHLKRHIRSIHTDEKPHVCPVQKCGKTFSRHDNLCQHMRVHGKFSTPADGGLSDELK